MSGKFSSTGTTFGGSSLLKQEQYIREIVQSQVFLIFQDIKLEIQTKIKSIDKNIFDLRADLKRILEQKQQSNLTDLLNRMEKIEAEMQILKYHHQNSLKVSRSKSLDKERKPIFKRQDNQYDFSSIVLDLENETQVKSEKKMPQKKDSIKPPLPKQVQKTQKTLQQNKSEPNIRKEERQIFKRNPVLEDTALIHRWLTENNNRQSSCFSSIIRQEQIEESVFY